MVTIGPVVFKNLNGKLLTDDVRRQKAIGHLSHSSDLKIKFTNNELKSCLGPFIGLFTNRQ